MQAMARVPRHRLVPAGDEAHAYRNRPALDRSGADDLAAFHRCLDDRTARREARRARARDRDGFGLSGRRARGARRERLHDRDRRAARTRGGARLAELGYTNIVTRIGDGYRGWPEHAPFDSIIVTAAAPDVPQALVEQLKTGGKLVIPIGSRVGTQTLYVVEKGPDGKLARRQVLAVRFVPMTGEARPVERRPLEASAYARAAGPAGGSDTRVPGSARS